MRNLIFFSLFILNILPTVSQENVDHHLDSLIQSFGDMEDTLLIKELNEKAFGLVVRSDGRGILIARKSLDLAKSIDYKAGKTDAINVIGINFDINGEPDSAIYYYDLFLKNSQEMNDSLRVGRAYNNMGMLNWHQGNFTEAIEMFYKSLKINEKLDNKTGIGNGTSNIGLIYMELKQYHNSLKYSKQSFNIRMEIKDSTRLTSSCNNIGICFKNLDQIDSAGYYYQLGIDYAIALNNDRKLAELYTNLGNLYVENDKINEGYEVLKKALDLKQSEASKAALYNSLSGTCFILNKPDEALNYALKSYQLNKATGGHGHIGDSYLNLAQAYYLNDQYDKAQEYYLKWGEAKDSVYSSENAKAIADFETRYQTEKKEKEIARQELEIAEQDLKLSNRTKLLFGFGGGILVIIFLSLYLIQRNKRKAQQEKDEAIIREKDKGLKAIIIAQEEERKRIAKDLHDGIVQRIAGIIMGWRKALENRNEDKEESELLKSLEKSSDDLRDISHRMMPRALSELGVCAAIEDMLDKSLGHTDIKFQFEHFGIKSRLAENIEITLYRITQELINNVIKHSKASEVNIQLFKANNDIILIVEDNGKGFSGKSKEGIGLLNISSRVDTVKGEINFEPSPQSGTLVTVKIPLGK